MPSIHALNPPSSARLCGEPRGCAWRWDSTGERIPGHRYGDGCRTWPRRGCHSSDTQEREWPKAAPAPQTHCTALSQAQTQIAVVSPHTGVGLQPQTVAVPGPRHRQEQKGCRQRAASFLFVSPQTQEGISRGNPSFIPARAWILPSGKQRRKSRANTYICAAAASPGSRPT